MKQLRLLGLNPVMLATEAYNRRQLMELTDEEDARVREILLGVKTHCYKRLTSTGRSYVRKADMKKWLSEQPREQLSRCLSILSVVSETKVYLFWSRDWLKGGEKD